LLLVGGEHLFGPTFPRLAESLRPAHTINNAKHY
jgi:hypothetical protein